MKSDNVKRLSRLNAILLQLQARRLVTAPQLAEKFNVTVRTIYRDIRALEDAGVPIFAEEGKGYSLTEGYQIPPVMFTADEANAIITAEFLVRSCKDESLLREFTSAVQKLKAIIPDNLKNKAAMLEDRIGFNETYAASNLRSKYLLEIQRALVEHRVVRVAYTDKADRKTDRVLEPFAIYLSKDGDWLLIAYCRLRKEFRTFSLTGIEEIYTTDENFEPSALTFAQYIKKFYAGK